MSQYPPTMNLQSGIVVSYPYPSLTFANPICILQDMEIKSEAFAYSVKELLAPYEQPIRLSYFLEEYKRTRSRVKDEGYPIFDAFKPHQYRGDAMEMLATLLAADLPDAQTLNEYQRRYLVFQVTEGHASDCRMAMADILLQTPNLLLQKPKHYDHYISGNIKLVNHFRTKTNKMQRLQRKLMEPAISKKA